MKPIVKYGFFDINITKNAGIKYYQEYFLLNSTTDVVLESDLKACRLNYEAISFESTSNNDFYSRLTIQAAFYYL
jgi:hypothetical protein